MPTKSATSLKDKVHDQIPGYRAALERERALRTLTVQGLHTVGNVGDVNVDYHQRITDAIDNGVTDLTELRESYTAAVTALQARAAFHQLSVSVMQQARADADAALADHADAALDYLRTELDTLMADVDTHRALVAAHPATAEQAISAGAGAVDNWQTVTGLLSRYDELRAVHRDWVIRQSGGNANMPGFESCAQVRRFLEVDPTWLYHRATTSAPSHSDTSVADWLRPTPGVDPADARRTSIWPASHEPADWLLIVCDNDPWLPDAATIAGCHTAAEELFRNAAHTSANWSLSRLAELTDLGAITNLAEHSLTH